MIDLFELIHNQTSSFSWNASADSCSWSGVTCSSSIVSQLSLHNFGLTDSSFLPLVCQIASLEALDVSRNFLSSIPNGFLTICGGIQGLKLVNFSLNQISGPLPSFSNGFTKLELLDLSHNLMTGTIGLQLNGLVGLKRLDLSNNNFTGVVPVKLGESMALEQLQLSTNSLQGPIPEQLADYKNLTTLDLSSNQLTGNIPSRIGQLQKLQVLVVSANELSGEVPDFISGITTLQRFAANLNRFSGAVPVGISRFLKNLDLSYNSLGGSISSDVLSYPFLQSVDLSYNRLVGRIPSNISSSLVRLRLVNNLLNGSILPLNCVELQNLVYLELDNNILGGSIPSGLGLCQKLTLLSLSGNNFSDKLPAELGNLTELQVLKLQLNNFGGEIPSQITKLPNLLILDISRNLLSGLIPPSISNLTNLQFLHLQGNNLNGSIPKSIGDMNSLIELQLGKNRLSGYIPSMPRNLQYALNLSSNLFKGQIPESLDQLNTLEILDLSNNRFSGEIPKFLASLQSLTTLLLNNNNLSGDIPTFRPNVMVDFKGNGILIKPPSGESPKTNSMSSHRKRLHAATIAAVISAALFGVIVAIVAVFLSRRLIDRVHEVEIQPRDVDFPLPKAIKGHLLTTNNTHKSSIDFTKSMEEVANPLNFVLKTKYSTYYKVTMPSGVSYFVKKINLSDRICQQGSDDDFRHELEALGKVNSSNIMTPLAYMLAADSAYLFYEMTVKRTLFDVLHRSSGIPLDWVSRCSIAVGVAQGLASLHGCSSGPILLFDLTSNTIMLKSLKDPQIGEIELYKVIDPSKSTSSLSAVAGSVGYIPPEYAYTMRVTMEGNVYSFGVILLEMLTGKQAVSEGTELAKWVLSNSIQPQKWDWMLDFSISRKSPAVKSQMLAVLKIALACINASSAARPKMKSVLRMLLNAR